MKRSLFWAAVEAAAKATRSGLSVVGALVDCGIPRQHAGEQWLTEFEEENACLEVPLSADFTDEAAAYFCNQCGPREQEDVDHCNYLRCRVVESQAIAQQLQESVFRSSGQTKQYGPRPRISTATPQNSRTNAGATSSRAVEEGLTEETPPVSSVSAADLQDICLAYLAAHEYRKYAGSLYGQCSCGVEFGSVGQWREHITELQASALSLAIQDARNTKEQA